jgi:methyl-accepting chemotaxis protein
MTAADLDRLEDEVALARARVADDVARLRSPAAYADFRDDVGHALSGTAQRAAADMAADIKNRAAANPAAVLAIGAGLLWRFAHRPPIATLLVGIGVASLLRTSPSSAPSAVVTRTNEMLHAANAMAGDLSEHARETLQAASAKAGELTEQARDALQAANAKAGELSEQAREAAASVAATASETTGRISEQAAQFATRISQSAERVADAAEHAFPGSTSRDTLLLGVAALSIGAAALINYRRTEA